MENFKLMSLTEFMEKKNQEKLNEAKRKKNHENLNEANSGNYQIELDVVLDSFKNVDAAMEALQKVCDKFKVKIIGLIPMGPGGGLPAITFSGSKDNLKNMYVEWYQSGGNEEDSATDFEEFVRPLK